MASKERPAERQPEQLGRYRVDARIGEGGAGEVFRAVLQGAGGFAKAVAIKRVRRQLVRDVKVRDDLLREAEIAKSLHHGNIVQMFDVGMDDGLPYLVMEYVDGVSLAELLRAESAGLPPEDALYVVEHVCAALEHAHGLADEHGHHAGIIHRDVKPRNILVSRDGVVKLTDFGIARPLLGPRRTTPGMIKGSLWYMAPEQLYGERVDERADQFSTGVVLHELLAGQNPLAAAEGVVQYGLLLERGLPRLPVIGDTKGKPAKQSRGEGRGERRAVIDDELADIAARATAPDPANRFASMAEFRAALETWRVTRGMRGASEATRRRVRAVMGMADARPPASLDAALADQLGDPLADTATASTRPTRPLRPDVTPTPPAGGWLTGRRVIAAVVVAALIGALAGVVAMARARSGDSAVSENRTVALAFADAAVDPVAADASAATPDATPDVAPADASPPDARAVRRQRRSRDRARDPSRDRARERARQARENDRRRRDDATRAGPPGRVKINLIPYADVTIDGRGVGRTPVDLPLSPGAHRVVLENPDTGQRKRMTVRVQSGATTTVTDW